MTDRDKALDLWPQDRGHGMYGDCASFRDGYDAALARAEAAELVHAEAVHVQLSWRDDALAAESRLAQATALLDEADNALTEYPEPRTESLRDRMQAFLSATPAQAAEPELCGECGVKHRPGENTLCPGWRPGPFVLKVSEHPDAIALRECRAELERERAMLINANNHTCVLQTALESARAERDTALNALQREQCLEIEQTAKLTTALARIAELEATVNNECSLRVQATDAAYNLQTRIAQAVAILEGHHRYENAQALSDAARETLEGER